MSLHLAEIANEIAPGKHAVLLLDQAGWHLSSKLVVPPNITIMSLPAKCPELNPQENVWQFLRDNWLSNHVFKSYEDILDHCCYAWNKLIEQPWRIMSIGMRDGLSVLINESWYKNMRFGDFLLDSINFGARVHATNCNFRKISFKIGR
jgi:hypothetical protein